MPDAITLAPAADLAQRPVPTNPTAIVQAAPLRACLSFLRKVVGRRNGLPILSRILVRGIPAKGDRPAHLELIATNMDTQLRRTVRADVPLGFEGTIDPCVLDRLLMALPRLADVTLIPRGAAWDVECPAVAMRARGLECLPVDDFPLLDNDLTVPMALVEIDAPAFAGALSRCLPCVSTEETRYYLNGVCLRRDKPDSGEDSGDDNRVTAVSTNGHCLMVTGFPGNLALPCLGIIVPRSAVALICLMLAGQQTALCAVPETKRGAPAMVVRTADGVEIITKTIDGTFPNYTAVIPQNVTRRITLPARDLSRALRLAKAPVSDDRSPAVKLEGHGTHQIAISTAGSCYEGAVTAHIAMQEDGQHPPLPAIGLNAHYLLGIVDIFGSDSLIWNFTITQAAQIFTAPDSADICLLMPMRV